ncbi:glycosyltransferase family 61 protein [Aquiflexum sp. LQ15W]|uniref:glycosyltransferase family 61 protein n=1 Tax=Cognataquiflexum nitidum TaxID=2922272 RepID=UPI001F146941|nr:glycosyltransferase family 61 protein [Cognataquiflexum nitidum]MCH6201344.1 glycosyltransferase family 61 protein [Cognataquiflexum nitidum]
MMKGVQPSNFWRKVSAKTIGLVQNIDNVSLFDGKYSAFADDLIVQKLREDCIKFESFACNITFKNVYVEPRFFSVIKFPATIIAESEFYEWQKLSLRKYFLAVFFKKQLLFSYEAVLFDNFIGLNYFHFFNDILPIIKSIYDKSLDDKEILIGESLYNTKWFQYCLNNELVARLKWKIVSQSEYLRVNKLHFLRVQPYNIESYNFARKLFQTIDVYRPSEKLKVFVNRPVEESRHINNLNELLDVLHERGFLIVNLAELNIAEQIRLFKKSEIIVGPHGAGLTNIIFSDYANVKLLEVFPKNFVSAHYYWMSSVLGIRYAAISGSELKNSPQGISSFSVDVAEFERILVDLLAC